jgi:hypothetical protein
MDRIPKPFEVYASGNKLVLIYLDEAPENPRENCDNASTMWCWHRRYNLGDKDSDKPRHEDFDGWEAIAEYIRENHCILAMKPLYLMDHSGISISTGEFACRWDSGPVGFIFVTEDHHLRMMNDAADKATRVAWAEKVIRGDVEVYDDYLTGAVFRREVLDLTALNDTDRDNCGTYYGYDHKKSGLLADTGCEDAVEIRLDEALRRIKEAADEAGVEFYGWR